MTTEDRRIEVLPVELAQLRDERELVGQLPNATLLVHPRGARHMVDPQALFAEFYKDAPFVRVLGTKVQAEVVAVKGSMFVDLSWTLGKPEAGVRQLVITTALDNLVKGGAGQAVQSMNLMFALPESQGLDAPGLWP